MRSKKIGWLINRTRDIFERKYNQGYLNFAFGSGSWINNQRISQISAFYHPDGTISTYEISQFSDFKKQDPYYEEYSKKEFKEHLRKFEIKMRKKRNLEKIIKLFFDL